MEPEVKEEAKDAQAVKPTAAPKKVEAPKPKAVVQ